MRFRKCRFLARKEYEKCSTLDRSQIRADSAPVSFETIEKRFLPGECSQDIVRLSKPLEMHPALLVLLIVFFISLTLSLWGGALFPVFTTIIWLVLAGTAVVFLILYALVWFARTIYARHKIPSKTFFFSGRWVMIGSSLQELVRYGSHLSQTCLSV